MFIPLSRLPLVASVWLKSGGIPFALVAKVLAARRHNDRLRKKRKSDSDISSD